MGTYIGIDIRKTSLKTDSRHLTWGSLKRERERERGREEKSKSRDLSNRSLKTDGETVSGELT